MRRHTFGLLLLCLATGGCSAFQRDNSPSSGECTGAGLAMDADSSEFHRDDQQDGAEGAFVNLSYGGGTLRVTGHFSDMPESGDVGSHPLPAGGTNGTGLVDTWRVEEIRNAMTPALVDGTLTLTASSRDRIVGSWTARFDDSTTRECSFNLRRAYELDTDD